MTPPRLRSLAALLAALPLVSGCASAWPRQEAASQEVAATISSPAEARWTLTTVESASTPAQKKVLRHARLKTVVGEVVDVSCYLQLGKRGEAHIPCGQKCVRSGQPIGLLTDRGRLYLVIPEEHHPRRDGEASLVEKFAQLMAQRVRVTGMVTSHDDYRAIFVRSLPEKHSVPATVLLAQTVLLNGYTAAVTQGLKRLSADRYLARLWDQDAALWSADAAVQASIRQRLGWLSIAKVMAKQVEPVRAFAKELQGAGFTRALLLGMGGSSLFPEVCRALFGAAPGFLDVQVLDTTDPAAIKAHEALGPLNQTALIVSSKSGTTSETIALAKYFCDALTAAGLRAGDHAIAITDAGSPLESFAAARGFRRVFTHGPGTGLEVGGRFSALTYFGLVPAALMGIDIGRLLERVEEMFARCGPAAPLEENPAAQLGVILAALAQAGRDKMTMLCPPSLAGFGAWVEQLVAESTGKQGRGVAPICDEPTKDPSAYSADRLFVEMQLAGQPNAAVDRQVQALAAAGHPIVRIKWVDRYDLGGAAAKWSVATAIAGGLLGVNPFDEPNVQESKDRTRALLETYVQDQRFPEEVPACSDSALAVYGVSGASGSHPSFTECLGEFFRQLRPTDYVAILSFLPRTAALDEAVHTLRQSLRKRLSHATMLGIGPRYLHSTGQLYKGGPDAGLFLLLTAEETQELPIPGERYGFSVLKHAQALGDFQAMQQKGRRILHVHFRGNIQNTVQRLLSAVDEATTAVAKR